MQPLTARLIDPHFPIRRRQVRKLVNRLAARSPAYLRRGMLSLVNRVASRQSTIRKSTIGENPIRRTAVGRPTGKSAAVLRFTLLLLLAATAGCSDRFAQPFIDPCQPDEHGIIRGIGPEGGEVRFTEEGHPMDGLTVRVPADTWDRCWSVYIWYRSIFGTPNYPEGFVPFERPDWTGSVEIVLARDGEPGTEILAPDSMYMEILFPLHSIAVEDAEVLSAFYYDTTSTSWEVRFPDELDEAKLTVKTSDWRLRWSWGRINLSDIDYDRYVAPVMEEQLGSETYHQVENTLDSLRYSVGPLTLDCVGLLIARDFFAAARDESYQTIQQMQGAIRCGVCDATTPEFYSELRKYLRLNVQSYIADVFFSTQKNMLIKMFGMCVALGLQLQLMMIECDYACFVRSMTWPFYMNMGIHYASQSVVELIHIFVEEGYMDCPLITDPEATPPEVPALQPIGSPSRATGGTDS